MAENKLSIGQRRWLLAYLSKGEPTFMNATRSAVKAWPDTTCILSLQTMGSDASNAPTIRKIINQYLDDNGLSNDKLDAKLNELMTAKETKFFSKDGIITDQVEVEALEVQRRTLDMAQKTKGRYEAHNKQQTIVIKPPDIDVEGDPGV